MLKNPIPEAEALKLSPMSLAFVGDAVQALYTRTRVTVGSTIKTAALHKEVTQVVKAVSQAKEADFIIPSLTPVEWDVFRRARNSKVLTSAKHAEQGEYRKASGLEAVIGFLFLTGNEQRLDYVLSAAFDEAQKLQEKD